MSRSPEEGRQADLLSRSPILATFVDTRSMRRDPFRWNVSLSGKQATLQESIGKKFGSSSVYPSVLALWSVYPKQPTHIQKAPEYVKTAFFNNLLSIGYEIGEYKDVSNAREIVEKSYQREVSAPFFADKEFVEAVLRSGVYLRERQEWTDTDFDQMMQVAFNRQKTERDLAQDSVSQEPENILTRSALLKALFNFELLSADQTAYQTELVNKTIVVRSHMLQKIDEASLATVLFLLSSERGKLANFFDGYSREEAMKEAYTYLMVGFEIGDYDLVPAARDLIQSKIDGEDDDPQKMQKATKRF